MIIIKWQQTLALPELEPTTFELHAPGLWCTNKLVAKNFLFLYFQILCVFRSTRPARCSNPPPVYNTSTSTSVTRLYPLPTPLQGLNPSKDFIPALEQGFFQSTLMYTLDTHTYTHTHTRAREIERDRNLW